MRTMRTKSDIQPTGWRFQHFMKTRRKQRGGDMHHSWQLHTCAIPALPDIRSGRAVFCTFIFVFFYDFLRLMSHYLSFLTTRKHHDRIREGCTSKIYLFFISSLLSYRFSSLLARVILSVVMRKSDAQLHLIFFFTITLQYLHPVLLKADFVCRNLGIPRHGYTYAHVALHRI